MIKMITIKWDTETRLNSVSAEGVGLKEAILKLLETADVIKNELEVSLEAREKEADNED